MRHFIGVTWHITGFKDIRDCKGCRGFGGITVRRNDWE